MKNLIHFFLSIGILSSISNCKTDGENTKRDSSKGTTTLTGTATNTNTTQTGTSSNIIGNSTTCEKAWNQMVSLEKKGTIMEYEQTTSYVMGGNSQPVNKMTIIEEVLVADNTMIQTRTTIKSSVGTTSQPTTHTKNRDQWIADCVKYGNNPPFPADVTASGSVLESRTEKITVQAGTFDCVYSKVKTNVIVQGRSSEGYAEVWTKGTKEAPTGVTVKQIQTTTISTQGQTMTYNINKELIRLTEP